MVVVDSSVWIDFFNGRDGAAVAALRRLLAHGEAELVIPDLVLYEVLRGFRHERDFLQARRLMLSMRVDDTGGAALAQQAATHYRALRSLGINVRSGIDVLVASFCIHSGFALLHQDRDFVAFEVHRGLRGLLAH